MRRLLIIFCIIPPHSLAAQTVDTPVQLMVMREISARTAIPGMRFRLETVAPVTVGSIAVPAGATAWGAVTEAQAAGRSGRGGRVSARLLSLEWNGRQWPLDGASATDAAGTPRSIAALTASIGPFAQLARGHDARLKAGEIVVGYIRGRTAIPAAATEFVTLPAGTPVWLETTVSLSSETAARGEIVPLTVTEDIRVDDVLMVRAGTRAYGQIVRADPKGGFGVGGRLALALRHVELDSGIVRLDGEAHWSGRNGWSRGTTASAFAAAAGLAITGRRAVVPPGTRISGSVLRDTALPRH